ncbi:hypothetical protein [Pseudomonas nitroreducens]|uniref:hypothetical protein n=1 Tax=Pseudomonas nitroreducens TaxID=46680 RepID=UPI00382588FA
MTHSHSAPTPVGPEHPVRLISLAVHSASAKHWGRPWLRRTLSVMYPRELTFKGIRLPTQPMQSWLHLVARAGLLKRRKAESAGSRQREAAKPPVQTPQATSVLAELAFEWGSEMVPDFAQFARLSRLKREQEQASVDGGEGVSDSAGDQEALGGLPGGADAILGNASMDAVLPDVLDADFLDPASSTKQSDEKAREATQRAEGAAAGPVEQQDSDGTVQLQAMESPSATADGIAPAPESVPLHSTIEPADSVAPTALDGIENIAAGASEELAGDESTAREPAMPVLPEPEERAEREPAIAEVHESAAAEPAAPMSESTALPVRQDAEVATSAPSVEAEVPASVEQSAPEASGMLDPVEARQTETIAIEAPAVDEPSLERQPVEVSAGVELEEQIDDEHLESVLPVQDSSEPSELSTADATRADVPDTPELQESVEHRVEPMEKSPEAADVLPVLHEVAVDLEPLPMAAEEPLASPEPEVAAGVSAMGMESLDEAPPAVQEAAGSDECFEPEQDALAAAVRFQKTLASGGQSERLMAEPARHEETTHGVSGYSAVETDVALEPIIASLEDALAMLAAASADHDQMHRQPWDCNDEGPACVGSGSIDVATAKSTQSTVPPAVLAIEAGTLADNYLEAAVLQGIFIQKETEMTQMHDELPEADVQETAAPVTSVELQEVSAALNVPQLEANPEDVLSDVQSTLNSLAGMAQGLTQQKQAAGRLQEELEAWNNQLQERERLAGDKEERLLQLENHLKEAKTNLDRMAAENNRLLAERSEALKELAQTVDMRDKATLKRAESIQLEQQRIAEQAASLRGRAGELDERESALKRKTEELVVRLKQLQSAKDKFSTIVKSFNETVQFNSTLSAISKTVTE